MTQDLTTTEQLEASLTTGSLRSRVEPKKALNALLLLDCSGSMTEPVEGGQRKIDALRDVVAQIRQRVTVGMVAFMGYGTAPYLAQPIYEIPEPKGGTPLDVAIQFALARPAIDHLIIVSDGKPDREAETMLAAQAFKGKIDVFYVGPPNDAGAQFMRSLAKAGGGSVNMTDLKEPPQLMAQTVVGYLSASSDTPPDRVIAL